MNKTNVPRGVKSVLAKENEQYSKQIQNSSLPEELREKCLDMLDRINRMEKYGGFITEFEKIAHYFDWIINLPWNKQSEDQLNLDQAKVSLNANHYGMDEIKERILEYIAVLKLTKNKLSVSRAPILCFVGLVGTGKTTFAYSIAEALKREFARIPFGGMGSALDLRGQSRLHPDNEPGQVIKALRQTKTRNPVILLDEIDRVSEQSRADIMGVLVELLDPGQNHRFTDHYVDFPFDLSDVLFIATCNNTTNISTAVLDRLEVLQMPSYTDNEKIRIGHDYILPRILKECGLSQENISIDDELWPKIVRPLGFDAGIRTLERTIKGMCRKVAKLVVLGEIKHLHLNNNNIKDFLPSY